MTGAEITEAGVALYGKWAWKARMAKALGVDVSTVRRWVVGETPVPGPVAAALACFLERSR